GPVRVRVLDAVAVEVLVYVGGAVVFRPVMAAAERLGLDGPLPLHPAELVDDVDEEVVEGPAAGPQEAVEPPDLGFQIADVVRLGRGPEGHDVPLHAVAVLGNDLAQFAGLHASRQLLESAAVA